MGGARGMDGGRAWRPSRGVPVTSTPPGASPPACQRASAVCRVIALARWHAQAQDGRGGSREGVHVRAETLPRARIVWQRALGPLAAYPLIHWVAGGVARGAGRRGRALHRPVPRLRSLVSTHGGDAADVRT